ncbi:hypothetical protein LXA43DRAFT_720638 [Ganoderma leucocontextum]|nr:hypothetical protein LXA43DRAFT_720638 [Ganoderma leucocontextum]
MADAAFENPAILNLMGTYGPLLIGALLSCVLYGMAVIQIFLYFSNYERDSIWMKLYVVLVWAIETASTTCVLAALWPVLILKWGSLHELSLTQSPMLHRVWMTGLGTFLVHMFYIYRIYMVNGRKPLLPCLLIPFTLYQMIETCVYVHSGLSNGALSTLSGNTLTALGMSGRAAIAFIDIAIAALMVHALLKGGVPQFKSSRKMIFRLVILTINTGLWTAVFAILVLIMIIPYQNELYYTAVDFPLTSLYLNSLLANLNAREYVRSAKGDVECNSYQLGDSQTPLARFRTGQTTLTSPKVPGDIRIHARMDTLVKLDSSDIIIIDAKHSKSELY